MFKHITESCTSFLVLCWCALSFLSPTLSQAQDYLNSVVKIESLNTFGQAGERGTGLVVGEIGTTKYILTANHVVQDADINADNGLTVEFKGLGDRSFLATIEKQSPDLDIAVIKVVGVDAVFPKIRLIDPFLVKEGLDLIMVGHPKTGDPWQVNDQNSLTVTADEEGFRVMSSIGVEPGFSGGPLLSKKKKQLLGIMIQVSNNNAKAVDIERTMALLKVWNINTELILPSKRSMNKLTFPMLGVGIAALGSAIYFQGEATKNEDKYNTYTDETLRMLGSSDIYASRSRDETRDLGNQQASLALYGYVLSGACIATTIWLNTKKRKKQGLFGSIQNSPSYHVTNYGKGVFQWGLSYRF